MSFKTVCDGKKQSGYCPHKTLYQGFMQWSRLSMFDLVFDARRRAMCVAAPANPSIRTLTQG